MKQALQHRHFIKFESALRSLVTPSIHMQVGCIISRAAFISAQYCMCAVSFWLFWAECVLWCLALISQFYLQGRLFGNAWGSPIWPRRCSSTARFPRSKSECSQQGSFDYNWNWIGCSCLILFMVFLICVFVIVPCYFCVFGCVVGVIAVVFACSLAWLLWYGLHAATRLSV